MKILVLISLFCIFYISASSQEITVKGNVTSKENNYSLPGVNIVIQGTTEGTITDLDGNYELIVDKDATLVFSFIGYENKTVEVKGRTEINVSLDVKTETIEETVVIGYGVVTKKDLTGSVEVVESDKINRTPVLSTEQVLQGKASGVFVAASSGAPGSSISVRVRGVGTPNNTDPLYIVDGMPIKDASFGKHDNPSGINYLNPSDIESIQILKDASAAAIYGTRGANGVVIVTTKKGKSGKMSVDFNAYYGFQQLPKKIDVLNAQQFAELYNYASGEYFSPDTIPMLKTTNWQDEVFTLAPTHNEQISVSGGGEKSNFYISLNQYSQDGIVKKSYYDRYSLRLNSEYQVNKWLKVGEFLSLTNFHNQRQKETGLGAGPVVGNPIMGSLKANPTVPPYDEDGNLSYLTLSDNTVNPLGLIERHFYKYNSNRIQGTAFAEIEFIKNLRYKFNAGLDRSWGFRKEVWPEYEVKNEDAFENTLLITEHEDWNNFLFEHTLNYNFDIDDGNHIFNILLGYTYQEEIRHSTVASSYLPEPDEKMYYHSARASIQDVVQLGGSPTEWALISYLGRLNYNYKNKYLLTSSIRRDGSSRFGKNKRWGMFPSFAFAWKISEEPFLENFSIISQLKLRTGWGIVGNQNIKPYSYTVTTTFQPDKGLPGPIVFYGKPAKQHSAVFIDGIANPNIGWETTETLNFGLDLSLLEDKFSSSVDLYHKQTTDILLLNPVPLWSGADAGVIKNGQIANSGKVDNKGIDVSLNYSGQLGGLVYNLNGNFSKVINEVVSREGGAPLTSDTKFPVKMIEGEPLGVFYGYVTEGIFKTEEQISNHAYQEKGTAVGDLMFKDLNLDGKIDDSDQTSIGYALPDFTYGFGLNLTYGNFELNVATQGVYGNSIANMVKRDALYNFRLTTNVHTDLLDFYGRELEDGSIITDTDIPKIGRRDRNDNDRISNYFLEDGSYFRIKTLTFSYNVPKRWIDRIKISKFRLFVTAQNLHTFTKYSGFNPEIGVSPAWNANPLAFGIDNAVYPLPRTFLFGLNISF
jgi:TonB-dependent starch-binding outer membrane protein SusC